MMQTFRSLQSRNTCVAFPLPQAARTQYIHCNYSPFAGSADLVNAAVVLGFDAVLLYTCGIKSLAYLLAGTVMGGGLHPMAGHLISEHYMFVKVHIYCSAVNDRTRWLCCGACWGRSCRRNCIGPQHHQIRWCWP